jgi:hypothetical protein
MGIIRRDYYKRGDHNSISDQSGQKYKRGDMKLQWDGLLVGIDEYDPKHPQLTLRPPREDISVKNQTRTEDPPTNLLDPPYDPAGGV